MVNTFRFLSFGNWPRVFEEIKKLRLFHNFPLPFSALFYLNALTLSLDEMGSRIDDLEKSIVDLTKEMGIEVPPSSSGGNKKDQE